ncbi:TPA: hypothetical protein ACTZ5Q_005829 [Bacillus cereus]
MIVIILLMINAYLLFLEVLFVGLGKKKDVNYLVLYSFVIIGFIFAVLV